MATAKKKKTKIRGRKAKGVLITFEGIDGSGKSTQAKLAFAYLRKHTKRPVVLLREPGSTAVSEAIRAILLKKSNRISDLTELLLYEAARAQLVSEEIDPLLAKGTIVLCDRFFDSSTAYQGYGRGLNRKLVQALNIAATSGLVPALTLVYDIPLATAVKRRSINTDRLESEKLSFHRRVRAGFLKIAKQEPKRVKVIDTSKSSEEVFQVTRHLLETILAKR